MKISPGQRNKEGKQVRKEARRKAPADGVTSPDELTALFPHRTLILCLLLSALVIWTFLPAIHNGFVGYDDPEYVTANARVQQGLTLANLRWAFVSLNVANWQPLTWLSHMLDCQLFGLAAWGHHLTSILLHAINTILVFLVLQRMTGATWRSLAVAALFGLHPLHVQSVAWISERKDVLSTLFWMLTLWAYARFTEGQRARGSGERFFYGLSLTFLCLGLMAKPMLVTLPCVLLVLDVWPLRRWPACRVRRLLLEKIPFFVPAAAVSVVTLMAQKSAGAMTTAWPLTTRLENALVSYCRYVGKLLWPEDLAVFYPYHAHWPIGLVVLAGFLLLLISVGAVAWRREHPYILIGWLWFLGTLVPVIGLVQVGEQAMADRYSYVPSIGLFLSVVWGAHALSRYGRLQRIGLPSALAVCLLLCIAGTRKQIGFWRDSETLFLHALRVTRGNYLAHNNLGTAYDRQGRLEEAVAQFEAALAAEPDYPEAHKNLGLVLIEQGRLSEAIRQFQEAVLENPRYAQAQNAWGLALERQGRVAEAITRYREATRLQPDYADAHYNLGVALGRSGQLDEAIAEFRQAIRCNPASFDAYNNLGVTLERKGEPEQAMRAYLQALRLRPDYARAHFNLGVALLRTARLDEAIREFQAALRLQPDYPEARRNLELAQNLKRSSGLRNAVPAKR